jgi:hypothetical protein
VLPKFDVKPDTFSSVPTPIPTQKYKITSTHMQNILFIVFAATFFAGTGCAPVSPRQTPLAQCLTHFPPRPGLPDTLHCFLAESPEGAPLSDTLLKMVLDSAQFENLHFGTGDARFHALGQFPFAPDLQAGLVRTEEHWFGKQSLLIFDLRRQKCLAVVELAHFYGGDGGQTASESWLFRDGIAPRLFVKNAEHWITPPDDPAHEPQEYLREQGQLLQWKAGQFQRMTNPDSSLFMRQYRMRRTW